MTGIRSILEVRALCLLVALTLVVTLAGTAPADAQTRIRGTFYEHVYCNVDLSGQRAGELRVSYGATPAFHGQHITVTYRFVTSRDGGRTFHYDNWRPWRQKQLATGGVLAGNLNDIFPGTTPYVPLVNTLDNRQPYQVWVEWAMYWQHPTTGQWDGYERRWTRAGTHAYAGLFGGAMIGDGPGYWQREGGYLGSLGVATEIPSTSGCIVGTGRPSWPCPWGSLDSGSSLIISNSGAHCG